MTESPAHVEVQTAAGRVRGAWREVAGSSVRSAAFLGIPFAQAPVGDLRFAAPQPAEPWPDVRDALEQGATAQRGDPGVTLIPEPSVPGESTLNANVFTPAPGDTAAKLPVLVWIHGGGYFAGSPASPWYDGRAFNRDGVVTVSIGYRLGFDGFGHIEGAPSNRGVRDWLAGLEWVQQNIAAFGGDPSRVTIAGQSAGGGAVLTLLGMPAAQHLFHGVYALSSALADVSPERARAFSTKMARELGVPATRDGFASVSEEEVLTAQRKLSQLDLSSMGETIDEGLGLGPAIDDDLIVRPTTQSLAQGIGSDKPLVLGAADDEFSMAVQDQASKLRWIPLALLLRPFKLSSAVRRGYLAANRAVVARGHAAVLGRLITDKMFRTGVVKTARARGGAPTWVYRIAFRSTKFDAAVHCIDVPFFFDCLDGPAVDALTGPNPPQALADAIHGAAVTFVKTGNPGWTAWSAVPNSGIVFGGATATTAEEVGGFASVEPLL
ncbi:carboxylesterase/lipase family protein [Microbacterium gorillae]|uniref:carboxylesterase/lipase family protein n=1 Tax=Microbacterium gorillae TaxID=1231063 RepID=UPI003D97C9CC